MHKEKCGKINNQYLDNHPGNDIFVQAKHIMSTQQKYKPRICKKEGAVANTSFMDNLRVKIGCKVILIHNIDTSDGLTNGQLGKLIDIIKTEEGSIAKLIIQFQKKNVGKQSRIQNPKFAEKYPKGTVLEKLSFSYSLSKKSSTGSSKATVIQFPLKVAYAITAHKIQGQTIPKPLKVAVDISSIFEAAQAHVMLSRVEEFEQIFILDSLPEEKIHASPKALTELGKMNSRSINQNPIPWNQDNENFVKVASLNCMSLKNNHYDIIHDKTLMESTLIALSETWLDQDTTWIGINGYKSHFNSIGPGKGLALYYKESSFHPVTDIKTEKIQISKLKSTEMEVIVVYRTAQGNSLQLIEHLTTLISEGVTTIVCGDFNICYLSNRNNRVTQYLEADGFLQLMNEATHIKGGHIDHFYFKPGKTNCEEPSIFRYSPYYSDHDAICATLLKNHE